MSQNANSKDVFIEQVNLKQNGIWLQRVGMDHLQNRFCHLVSPFTFSDMGNCLYIYQKGKNNRIDFTQIGKKNLSRLAQYGQDNLIVSEISGNSNCIDVIQLGEENLLMQFGHYKMATGVTYQMGRGNEIIQINRGANCVRCNVMQRGSLMKVVILNGY